MVKKIIFLVCTVLFLGSSVYALEGDVKDIMSSKIHKALIVIKDKNETTEQKAQKIFDMFDEAFDYNLMARLSVGSRVWRGLSDEQKKSYTDTFVSLLKQSFIEKLKLYNDQDIVIKDFIKTKQKRAKLDTELVGKKDTIKIDYKFYLSKKRGWLIYDVVVADVSIIQSYRKQFSDLLNNMSFDEFLKKIKEVDTEDKKQ